MIAERNLSELLPILDIASDAILSKQGDITIGFEVRLPEIFTLSNEDYESFHQAWVKAIRVLPKFTVFHKQDWFVEASYASDFSKTKETRDSFLSRSSEKFFNERPFLQHDCFIFLTKKPAGRKLSSSLGSNLLAKIDSAGTIY